VAAISDLTRYRELSPLGSGGMATVVLAEDLTLRRLVALKRVHTLGSDRGRSRMRREALVGASLSHPNLVSVYDVLAGEGGEQTIVMEYVEGQTLRDALSAGPGLGVPEALRVIAGVSAALDAIHRRGIVHRDVKPANILLGVSGAIKLADLGIATAVDRTRITTDGAVLGTFSYMAPEQIEGAPATTAVDVYALAAVAFEALSGRKARTEANPLALAHAISTQPPPDVREAWPQAPAAAALLLARGMAREPSQRPRSAGELAGRLRAALEPSLTAAIPASAPRGGPAKGSASRRAPVAATPAPRRPAAAVADLAASPTRAPRGPISESLPAARGPTTDEAARGPSSTPAATGLTQVARHRARSRGRILAAASVALVGGAVALAITTGGASPRPKASGAPARNRPASVASHTRTAASPGTRAGAAGHANRAVVSSPATNGAAASNTLASSRGVATTTTSSAPKHGTAIVGTGAAPANGTTTNKAGTAPASRAPTGGAGSSPASVTATTTSPPAASVPPATPPSSAAPAGNPVSVVESFYTQAAAHQYAGAWALADATFRAQLDGYRSFEVGQAGDRSITFDAAQVVSQSSTRATVAVRTTSVRTDGTKRCVGTVELVSSSPSTGWLLHLIDINCS
jgi:hypothetical protein